MADHLLPFPLAEATYIFALTCSGFSRPKVWPTPRMERVLPVVAALAGRYLEQTIFIRFISPERPEGGSRPATVLTRDCSCSSSDEGHDLLCVFITPAILSKSRPQILRRSYRAGPKAGRAKERMRPHPV